MRNSSTLTVDLNVILANLKCYIALNKNVAVMVKANGYGICALTLAKFIQNHAQQNVPFLGVSHVWEAIQLREAGIHMPLLVICCPPFLTDDILFYDLTAAVSSFQEVEALNQAAQRVNKKLPIHLFVNTGMNRFGISTSQALALYHTIHQASHLHLEGMMTHLATADTPKLDAFSEEQMAKFKAVIDSLPKKPHWIHLANSAAATRFPNPFCNLARIGLGMLGIGFCPPSSQLALTLTTYLVSIHTRQKGESIGYNLGYIMPKKGRVGLIPFGYYDGYLKSLEGKGYVLIHGKKAPIIGAICMDFILLDITNIPEAEIGDPVVLFNSQLTPETVASWSPTNVREILVRLSPRIERKWKWIPRISNALSNSEELSKTV